MSSHGKRHATGRELRRRRERESGLVVTSEPVWNDYEPNTYDPAWEEPPLLDQLREISEMREQSRLVERELVDELREMGVSWSDIGAALGMSGQGARQRQVRL